MQLEEARQILSDDELRLIHHSEDIPIIARIKQFSRDKLSEFDRFLVKPDHVKDYLTSQRQWLVVEFYLLSQKLGRCPTELELTADYQKHNNALRYRAFYVLKYPERVEDTSLRKRAS